MVRKLKPSCNMSKNPLGRPREFSSEEALIAATLVFPEKGFEGTSLADLTKAMGITRTSMYATFGNKEQLFRLTMERFTQAGAKHIEECLAAGTAREGVEQALSEGVKRFTDPHWGRRIFFDAGTSNGLRCVGRDEAIRRPEAGSNRVAPAGPVRPRNQGRGTAA